MSFEKDFIVIGAKTAIGYKEIFKYIQENKIWLGYRNVNSDMWLMLPDNTEKWEKLDANGKKLKHINACWFTNLDTYKRHEDLILYKTYNADEYPMQDDDVTAKKGIYKYFLSGDEKYLNIRAFTQSMKRETYEKQAGICPICKQYFEIEQMEADHITPWCEGGKTSSENCQMLCKECNRRKSNK